MRKKKVCFAIAQMNPIVGDYPGNTGKIIRWIRQAEAKKADFVIFPELALSGYPVWDLANKKSFVEEGVRCLHRIVRSTQGKKVSVALGFIDRERKGKKGSTNALAWIEKGEVCAIQPKRLLPTYDVFLEEIFFEAGTSSQVISSRGWRIGPTICEDIWDEFYVEKPIGDLVRKRANLILNISASPYFRGVAEKRDLLLKRHATHYGVPLVYVNQVGVQDDLIFDGRSLFVDANGRVLFRAPAFEEGLFFFEWKYSDTESASLALPGGTSSPEEVYQALILGIRDYCRKNGFKRTLVGLSGGIDSALVATLAVDALGARNVKGVTMPGSYSSPASWEDSAKLAKRLKIDFCVRPIREKYHFILKEFRRHERGSRKKRRSSEKVTLAMENLQARLRGLELMYLSNDEGRLLLSTGNKSELAMGYCTLYGDMAGGLCVLGDVYKTDVYRLAWFRNGIQEVIPESILRKVPSAELRPGQKDEDSLPPYDVLDEILFLYIEKNRGQDEIIESLRGREISPKVVEDVIVRVDHNEYKRRQTPPILRVTEKAWFGRRMPITNRFRS